MEFKSVAMYALPLLQFVRLMFVFGEDSFIIHS